MKIQLKPSRPSAKRVVAAPSHAVVPLKERRLNLGNKWDFQPAPENSKNYGIARRHGDVDNGIAPPTPRQHLI